MDTREWAESFKHNHSCARCPFVNNGADVGVGVIYDCDHICILDVSEIAEYMERYEYDMRNV